MKFLSILILLSSFLLAMTEPLNSFAKQQILDCANLDMEVFTFEQQITQNQDNVISKEYKTRLEKFLVKCSDMKEYSQEITRRQKLLHEMDRKLLEETVQKEEQKQKVIFNAEEFVEQSVAIPTYVANANYAKDNKIDKKEEPKPYRRVVLEDKTQNKKSSKNSILGPILFVIGALFLLFFRFVKKHISKRADESNKEKKSYGKSSQEEAFLKAKEKELNKIKKASQDKQDKKNAIKDAEEKRLQAISDRETYLSSISTSNPIKWGKYTIIISNAEKKFIDTYNFDTPMKYKKQNLISSLALTILFEECRLNKLVADDFIELLVGFGGDRDFHRLIKPVGNDFFDFEVFRVMYSIYNDFRARGIRPIVSVMATFIQLERGATEKDILELSDEYTSNPMFGRSV